MSFGKLKLSRARAGVRHRLITSILAASALTVAAAAAAPEASAAFGMPDVYVGDGSGGAVKADAERILGLAEQRGRVPVIVRMRLDFAPEGALSLFAAANQRAAIGSFQGRIVAKVADAQNVKRYKTVPLVAMTVDARGLRALLDDPNVISITEDVPQPPALRQSVPLIRANKVSSKPAIKGGQGWVVAVLDSGVQRTHKALKGKIVSEACYSTSDPGNKSKSVCPGGVQSSTASGSGKNCKATVDGCYHGTHVAGIAVGNPAGNPNKGVAPGAKLIPIQVFSMFKNQGLCGTVAPCPLSYQSDQIEGLERVYELRTQFKIASVNMSLGGGQFSTACNSDPRTPIIANLFSKKIATVIASGNNGFNGSVSAPGCIGKAVTVGSTTKADVISGFSNHAKLVDLLAPGSDITSALLGNKFGPLSGTSMAAPHVAGTWALLKKAKPAATVSEVVKALSCTGVKIGRAGVKKPRIDVLAAFSALKKGCP